VKPQVVVFLGDLFDEGSEATDPEYRRYYKRFASIFGLPRKQDPPDLVIRILQIHFQWLTGGLKT